MPFKFYQQKKLLKYNKNKNFPANFCMVQWDEENPGIIKTMPNFLYS